MPPASPDGHRTRSQILTFLIEIAELSQHYYSGIRNARAKLPSRQPAGDVRGKRFAVPGGHVRQGGGGEKFSQTHQSGTFSLGGETAAEQGRRLVLPTHGYVLP